MRAQAGKEHEGKGGDAVGEGKGGDAVGTGGTTWSVMLSEVSLPQIERERESL